jgi:spore germination protein KB
MLENGKIGSRQFMKVVILLVIGDGILVLPSIPALEAKQDAWIAAIFSVVIGMLAVLLYHAVGNLYPDLTLVQYSEKILGKWLGISASLLFLTHILITAAVMIREIGDFMTTQIMPETPIQSIHIIFLAIVMMAVRLGLETMTRSVEVFFLLVIILFLILVIFLLPQVKIENMQPIFEGGFKPILRGSILFTVLPFAELFIILMFFPYVNDKTKVRNRFLLGALLGGITLIITTTLSILVLGADMTARNLYPSYILAKKINVADFLQRIEAILAVIWFITVFLKTSFYFYTGTLTLAQMLKLKEYRSLVFPIGMILIVLSLVISPNIVYSNNFNTKIYPVYDITICVLLPLLLLGVGAFRKIRST